MGEKQTERKWKKKKNTEPNKIWNWMYSMMSVHMCVALLKEKPGLSSYFPALGRQSDTLTGQIRLFFGQPTSIFISSTEQRGYVSKEIPFVTVRCRAAFTRIIHNPSPRDSRGPVEGSQTGLVCDFYSLPFTWRKPTINSDVAPDPMWWGGGFQQPYMAA